MQPHPSLSPPSTPTMTSMASMKLGEGLGARLNFFAPSPDGEWRILSVNPVTGPSLPSTDLTHFSRTTVTPPTTAESSWILRGVTSNTRYVTNEERDALNAASEGLGRPQATRAACIPIRKMAAWWALSQQERRDIFETQSHHTANSMPYLPAIARQLHHCRDLGDTDFDFVTWFEYAPEDADAFEELVAKLRASPEWKYVDREVDIRLERV